MKLQFSPYTLTLKHTFTIASGSRTTTPVMLVTFEHDGIVGYGEASMPPYLGESHDTAGRFLRMVDLSQFSSPFLLENILLYVDDLAEGNHAAKAAVDIALHDWFGKKLNVPLHRHWGLDPARTPMTSFTIGIDTPEVVREKTREASEFGILKVKLGGDNDKEIIDAMREVTDKPLRIDANQGWNDPDRALSMIEWLAERNVEFIEQPMPREMRKESEWLKERSPLPLIADESVARLTDVPGLVSSFHGINIKLMKCTGLREAHKMILVARGLGLKVMLGCMTETSCAISAAAQLSPLVDWADLDGAELITNDPFTGVVIRKGRIELADNPGIGASEKK